MKVPEHPNDRSTPDGGSGREVTAPDGVITDHDRERSATASGLSELDRALEPLRDMSVRRLLDVGCGFGGLTRYVGDQLGAQDLHGVDIDGRALVEADAKGVVTARVDVATEELPYPDGHFDVVMSFGMMDYLPFYDPMVRELHRVLTTRGRVLVSLPNLASWNNRLMFLLGYQPRDVEISIHKLFGTASAYRGDAPSGHIHTATVGAFVELMEFHGFRTVAVSGASFMTRGRNPVLRAVDRLLGKRVSLARRFFYVGRKDDVS